MTTKTIHCIRVELLGLLLNFETETNSLAEVMLLLDRHAQVSKSCSKQMMERIVTRMPKESLIRLSANTFSHCYAST